MAVILIKRGPEATMPALQVGELALATDTRRVWIGTSAGNDLVSGEDASTGLEADAPALADGQFYYATDTGVLLVGSGGTNHAVGGSAAGASAAMGLMLWGGF